MTWRHLVALLMAFSLLAAACGSSGGDSADGESGDVETGAQQNDEDSNTDGGDESDDESASTESTSEQDYESPLGDFLGFTGFDNSEDSQAEFEAEERERQETIAACMRAQGFEYTPVDPSTYSFYEDSGEYEDWGSEEWTRKWGFGISTMRFSENQVSDGVLGNTYDRGHDNFDPNSDPNYVYSQSLTEAERKAYEQALYGSFPELPEDATEAEWEAAMADFEPEGCEADTYKDDLQGEAFFSEFGDELEAMWEALESDPRIVAKESEIERCVTDKGLVYLDDEEQYDYFENKLSPIDEALWASEEQSQPDITEEEAAQMTEEELEEAFGTYEPPKLSAEQNAELKAIQEEEIAMAVAVLDCGGGWEQLEETFEEVRIEYEQRFLDENAAALAAYKDSAGN